MKLLLRAIVKCAMGIICLGAALFLPAGTLNYPGAFLLMLVGYPPIIVRRILDEERTLADGLPGYRAYMGKVRYRLIPLLW